jgi:hypothetical protein
MWNPQWEDRRRAPRFLCGTSAWITDPVSLAGTIRDLSVSGLFLELPDDPALKVPAEGTEVRLRFQLDDRSDTLRVRAVVARHEGEGGIGLEFAGMMPPARAALERYVAERDGAAGAAEADSVDAAGAETNEPQGGPR